MIDKILILACDRPNYLKKCLDAVSDLGIKIVVFVDIPNQPERLEGHKSVLDLLKTYKGVKVKVNNEHKGCTASMYNMLEHRGKENTFLILEDDIILKKGVLKEIKRLIKGKDDEAYILKLNDFFWGWVTNAKTLDLISELRTGSNLDEIYKNDTYYQSLKVFYKDGIHMIWDEVFQGANGYYGIEEIKSEKQLTENIGEESSRRANPQDKQQAKYALFVDGVFKETANI